MDWVFADCHQRNEQQDVFNNHICKYYLTNGGVLIGRYPTKTKLTPNHNTSLAHIAFIGEVKPTLYNNQKKVHPPVLDERLPYKLILLLFFQLLRIIL